MNRSLRIDFLKGICMFYITAIFHLTGYLGGNYYLFNNVYGNSFMCSCLGTFSLLSGILLGGKYSCSTFKDVNYFYKKRLLRFYPLFLLATICLYLIGFNDFKTSIYALLGLAPFVSPRAYTLWYISMIMIFYLLSPFVLTNNNKQRIIRCVILFLFWCFLYWFVDFRSISIDFRFIFNLLCFLFGVCIVRYKKKIFGSSFYKRYKTIIYCTTITIYLIFFLYLSYIEKGVLFKLSKLLVDYLGVIVLIILSDIIKMNRYRKVIYFLSYISMSFYLFHRFTYWACLSFYKPENIILLFIYLLLVSVPLGMFFSYYIQKTYDALVTNLKNQHKR